MWTKARITGTNGALIEQNYMKKVVKTVPDQLIQDQNDLEDLLQQIATLAHTANEYKSARQKKPRKKAKR
jgi:phage-related protein